nr:Hsp70 family protein [Nocardia paucivorans]
MRKSLGVSAGNEVVCSALVTTAPNGAQTFDYRVVSADAHSDLGDLVASSIELMTTQLPTTQYDYSSPEIDSPPTGVTVAYRDQEQAQAIRLAVGRRHNPHLISETTAALTYLRSTGLVDRYDTIALVDLGASGCSVSVADRAGGEILHTARTTAVSGRAIDDLIYRHLLDQHYARRGTRPNRSTLVNRSRAAKEHLSIAPAVTIDHVAGRPLKLTRADFEELIAGLLRDLTAFTALSFRRGDRAPEAVVVIGGGAHIPAVLTALERGLDIPVLTLPDPDAVIAKGAALVADAARPSALPLTARSSESSNTLAKVLGTMVGAAVVVGLIIGYGVNTMTSGSDEEVSPAGTTSGARLPPPPMSSTPAPPVTSTVPHTAEPTTVPPPAETITPTVTYPAQDPTYIDPDPITIDPTTTTESSTETHAQPTLRPDPNLPHIPFPELLSPESSAPGPPYPPSAPTNDEQSTTPTSRPVLPGTGSSG